MCVCLSFIHYFADTVITTQHYPLHLLLGYPFLACHARRHENLAKSHVVRPTDVCSNSANQWSLTSRTPSPCPLHLIPCIVFCLLCDAKVVSSSHYVKRSEVITFINDGCLLILLGAPWIFWTTLW